MDNELSFLGTQQLSYFNTKALSNSLMSIYVEDFYKFTNYWVFNNPLDIIRTEPLKLGSVVDTLLTTPEKFNDRYHIYNGTAPTGQMLKFCEELSRTIGCNYEIAYSIVEAQNGGKLRDKIEVFKTKFESFKGYYDTLMDSSKEVITTPMKQNADRMVSEVKSNPRTRILVNAQSSNNIEVFHQVEIFVTIDGIPCKGAIDKIIVDHNKKRIIVVDYKTSMKAVHFIESVIEYNYYRQGSYYLELIQYWIKEKGFDNYQIMDFLYVVISSIKSNHHFVYRLTESDAEIAKVGGYLYNGEYVKGWREILDEIVFMTKLGNWQFPYELSQGNVIDLDIFKKE